MRRTLALLFLLPLCFGFEWPGRLPRLTYELAHADGARRKEIVRELSGYAAADVREVLLGALEDDDADVRLAAAAALGEVRERQAAPTLISWADDKAVPTRVIVVRALGQIGDARAQPVLVRALADSVPEVRSAACAALHELGGNDATGALLGALADSDASVRFAAIDALRELVDARAVSPLAARLRDDAPEVRSAAIALLGSLHDARGLSLIAPALQDGQEDVRIAAASALGELGDAGALTALRKATTGHTRLAKAALAALGRIDDARAVHELVVALARPELAGLARTVIVERARRLGAGAAASVTELASALTAKPAAETVTAIADTLTELARWVPTAAATEVLINALRDAAGSPASLTSALLATQSEAAFVPALEALDKLDDTDLPGVLTALVSASPRGDVDGRAADPLVARLPRSKGAARTALVHALGLTHAARVLPVLLPLAASEDRALRLAALEALGAIGGPAASAPLFAAMTDRDPEVRDRAGHALGAAAALDDVHTMLEAVRAPGPTDRQAFLIALGGALPRLAQSGALSAETRALARDTLLSLIVSDDDALSDRALDTLRSFAPPEGAATIARMWRMPSSHKRAAGAFALSAFDGEETRKLLRFMLQNASPELAIAIADALGEVGDKRDANALIHLAQRKRWPVPAAATFALARLAQRGELKKHAVQSTLCAFGRSHEPYVRANVAAALAALSAGACDDEVNPLRWLDARHAPAVRSAAAVWAQAAALAGALPADAVAKALRGCALDIDTSVSDACTRALQTPAQRKETAPAARSSSELYVYASDGVTPLRNQLVALRLPDGAAFVGHADSNAHVVLRSVPPGELLLEDPAQAPLDP